jgi:hypothetical protein
LVAALGGVSRWRASCTRVEVKLTRQLVEERYDMLIIVVVNMSGHAVQVAACGFEDQGNPERLVELDRAPQTIELHHFTTFWVDPDAGPINCDVAAVAWVRLAAGQVFRSPPTVVGS